MGIMNTTPAPRPPSPPFFNAASTELTRRAFLQRSVVLAGGCALCAQPAGLWAAESPGWTTRILSPGCRRSKVRVAKLYLPPGGLYFGCRQCYRLTYRSAQEHDPRVSALFRRLRTEDLDLMAMLEQGDIDPVLVLKAVGRW